MSLNPCIRFFAFMATSTFTSWADLYDALLDRLASGDYRITQMTVAGKSFSFNTSTDKDFMDLLDRVESRVKREAGKQVRRIYMGNKGRG